MRVSVRGAGFFASLALLLVTALPAAAQETGKVEGRVTDQSTGQPLVGAQVVVVGTRFGNVTNEEGYYFINNVPAGVISLQAQFIGYQSVTLTNQRVLAGQTATANFALPASAIELEPIEVVAETRPLVPRDQVASKAIVTGETVDELPVDDVDQVLRLQPGVVESETYKGLSIRGGRSGEEAVYVDGILVRSYNYGDNLLEIGTNSLSEVDVLTGGFSAEFGEAQSGIINYVTRSGGTEWTGAFSFQSDELAPDEWSVGLNRAELSLGGPLFGPLSLFISGTAQGQRSANRGKLWRDVPIFVADGVDTVVTITETSASTGQLDERQVVIPRFELYDRGGQIPFSPQDEYSIDGKLDFSYGTGSRAFVSAKQSRVQNHYDFGGLVPLVGGEIGSSSTLYNPMAWGGSRTKSRMLMAGLTHNFFTASEQALSVDFRVSLQNDEFLSGVLDPEFERDHRNPTFGFTFSDFEFLVDEEDFPVNEQLVQNFLRNEGRRTPFEIGRTDVRSSQEFRLNPYGVLTGFPLSGITTSGFNYANEDRVQFRGTVDWQANRYNRIRAGAEYNIIDLAAAQINYADQGFGDVWVEEPTRGALFAQDRIDIGDVVVEAGLRWDYFDPNTEFPITAGFFDPDDPTTFASVDASSEWSPRLGVSFPVTVNSTFRLSYGHFVQIPDLNEYYQGKNVDFFRFRNTNTNDIFGRPLDPGKTVAFEFGYRQLLSEDFVLDVAAYNKDKMADVAIRKLAWADPTNPGTIAFLNTITNADFGTIRGVDLRLDRRFGQLLAVMVGYSFQDARGTGSDPYTYTRLFARLEGNANQLLGLPPNPAQAVRPLDENRRHNLTGNFSLSFPSDYDGFALLRDFGVFGTFRFASGLPCTPLEDTGEQVATCPPSAVFEGSLADLDVNTLNTPWIREFDLRVTRGFDIAGFNARVFADVRNLFDFENRLNIFSTTGDIVDPNLYDRLVQSHQQLLGGGEARDIDLTSVTAAGSGVDNEADLVALWRAEDRFGNGDKVFTVEEQDEAFREAVMFQNGPQWLVGTGRRLRLGFEVTF